MKLFSSAKDGGPKSNVIGFWLVEIKPLFSIVFLKFNPGCREAFHSHAFNALTWWIKGTATEYHLDGRVMTWKPSILPKYTPRDCFHKIYADTPVYALSFRGPWADIWNEYVNKRFIALTHGRKVVRS